jgi:hypothetical protein
MAATAAASSTAGDQELITVTIPSYPDGSVLQKDLLCKQSDVLEENIDDLTAPSARVKSLILTGANVATIQMFVRWLHTGNVNPQDTTALKAPLPQNPDRVEAIYDDEDDMFHCAECSEELGMGQAGQIGHAGQMALVSTCGGGDEEEELVNKSMGGECSVYYQKYKIHYCHRTRRLRAHEAHINEWTSTFISDRQLLKLYIFAWKYRILKLCNDVVTTWVTQDDERNCLPQWDLIERAFDKLPRYAPLCQYLVDVNMYYWHPGLQCPRRDGESTP